MSSVRITEYITSDETDGHSLFYSPKWISVLRQVYGYKIFTAADTSQGLQVHLAFVDNIAGRKLVSLPFSDYTDIDNGRPNDYSGIIDALMAKFPQTPILLKTIGRNEKLKVNTVFGQVVRKALCHKIPMEDNNEVKGRQSSSFQRNIRKAEKAGVTVQRKTDALALKNFYDMYHELRLNKFGSIPQPYSFFKAIFAEFVAKDAGFLLEASFENKPIASIIVLQLGPNLYYKFGASTEESLDLRPNNLIFDALIGYASEKGSKAIDLGLSGTGESYKGLVRFKESMGGVPTPITYYQLDNGHENTDQNKDVKKWLGDLTDTIVSMRPDPKSTSKLSETIYPLFA